MKKFIKAYATTVGIAVLFFLPIQPVHAGPVTPSQYSDFVTNINEGWSNGHVGRYLLEDSPVRVSGEVPGSGTRTAAILCWCAGFAAGHYGEKLLNAFDSWVTGLFDPQDAFLFSEFKVGSVSIFDALIDVALLPENRLYEADLPHFLGGSKFTATKAFTGVAYDFVGDPIASGIVDVGFGVFQTSSGQNYFSPINFSMTAADLGRIGSMGWELAPVTSGLEGQLFEATGLHLQVSEHPIPEPSGPSLLILALALLLLWSRRVEATPGIMKDFSWLGYTPGARK